MHVLKTPALEELLKITFGENIGENSGETPAKTKNQVVIIKWINLWYFLMEYRKEALDY